MSILVLDAIPSLPMLLSPSVTPPLSLCPTIPSCPSVTPCLRVIPHLWSETACPCSSLLDPLSSVNRHLATDVSVPFFLQYSLTDCLFSALVLESPIALCFPQEDAALCTETVSDFLTRHVPTSAATCSHEMGVQAYLIDNSDSCNFLHPPPALEAPAPLRTTSVPPSRVKTLSIVSQSAECGDTPTVHHALVHYARPFIAGVILCLTVTAFALMAPVGHLVAVPADHKYVQAVRDGPMGLPEGLHTRGVG